MNKIHTDIIKNRLRKFAIYIDSIHFVVNTKNHIFNSFLTKLYHLVYHDKKPLNLLGGNRVSYWIVR